MLRFLKARLEFSNGFTLDIITTAGARLERCGVTTCDEIGIVVHSDDDGKVLLPWSAIARIHYEEA